MNNSNKKNYAPTILSPSMMSSDGMRQIYQIPEEQDEYENHESIEQKDPQNMKAYTEEQIWKKRNIKKGE